MVVIKYFDADFFNIIINIKFYCSILFFDGADYLFSQNNSLNIEEGYVQTQISKDVRALIDELPPDQREVVILRHYIGLSFKEIAEHTNVSINTALGRMRYALINLRKLVREKNLSLTIQ